MTYTVRSNKRIVEGMEALELGDLLIAYLEQLGVEYVFGIPGGAIEPLFNALARSERRGGPRAIISRHETGAAFMADGYTSATGKLGVCCGTTGPGATNLVTGVASAYANHLPMLVITAQTALSTFGKGAFQESSCTGTNTVSLFDTITRYNTLVSHPDQFEQKLAAAVMTAFQAPGGPVHLSIPIDIFRAESPVSEPRFDFKKLASKPAMLDTRALENLYRAISQAKKPVFLVGDGAGPAIGTLLSLAMQLQAPVISTPHGKGLVSPFHPLYHGAIGFAGHASANSLLADRAVDLVVAVGTTLGEWATNGWDQHSLLNQRLVHVDSAESNFVGSPMAQLHVRGDLDIIFEELLERAKSDPKLLIHEVTTEDDADAKREAKDLKNLLLDDPESFESPATPIKPQRLMRDLATTFPPQTRYFADTGASFAWATHYLHPYDRRIAGKRDAMGGVFRACLEFSSMGWAVGCSVGAALARPGTPVVCITGDGSLLMCGQEITVALQEKLPVIFVVLNDSAYGMVKHGQHMTGAESIGTELPFVNFAAMANAMGIEGIVIESPDDFAALDIKKICARKGPTLLDVRIDVTEVPPIGVRIDALKQEQ